MAAQASTTVSQTMSAGYRLSLPTGSLKQPVRVRIAIQWSPATRAPRTSESGLSPVQSAHTAIVRTGSRTQARAVSSRTNHVDRPDRGQADLGRLALELLLGVRVHARVRLAVQRALEVVA